MQLLPTQSVCVLVLFVWGVFLKKKSLYGSSVLVKSDSSKDKYHFVPTQISLIPGSKSITGETVWSTGTTRESTKLGN